jgi:hypothetical protein
MLQLRLKWSNLWLRRLSAPYKPNQVILFLTISVVASVADPHHVDPDADPACHFDADPDPVGHFDADPDPDPAYHLMRIRILPFSSLRIRIHDTGCGSVNISIFGSRSEDP